MSQIITEPPLSRKINEKSPEIISQLADPGSSHSRLIPLVDWPKYHPWPPLGGLRHMAFHAKTTGFSKVLKKCGRRVLIDEKKFFEFIEENNLITQ